MVAYSNVDSECVNEEVIPIKPTKPKETSDSFFIVFMVWVLEDV